MALIVEDDTGLTTAESYASVVALQDYCTARGIEDVSNFTETELEAKLRLGFDFINMGCGMGWRYKSVPLVNEQAGEFPRDELSDGRGRTFSVVPKRVKDANCEAAIALFSTETTTLLEDLDRGGKIKSESIGPISVTYADDAPVQKLFSKVTALVAPFVKRDDCPEEPLPSYNDYAAEEQEDPLFSVGMDDNPGPG
jgi:hypothetical protein